MTDQTQPTPTDPDLPVEPDTAAPPPEAPDPDRPADPGTSGPVEPEPTARSASPTAAFGGPVSSELDGPEELDRVTQEEPTTIERN